ncbi:MAG: hypothetical protein HOO93_05555 [Methyloglobulus sp.]|nr:hypothetical protein [Methyloglobulus sp.]
MQQLKLSSAPDSVTALKNRYSGKDDSLLELFPKPQYFQVHFQNLHEHNQQLHEELAQLKDTVAKTDEKLGRLLALLSGKSVMGQ